ncbi:hypothetical protein H0O02_04720 [Candidatus Micrarchaeota archaeon]|nr:hypothetical protein [Candidatus Micrarchaeota archaeon]
MFSSIKRAFSAYSAKPFLFMWGSFAYFFLFLVLLLAMFGLLLIYFMAASLLSYDISFGLDAGSLPTLLAVTVILLLLFYFLGGLNAALAKTYYGAVDGAKTSLLDFYHYGLSRAPVMFGILLMREVISVLLIGPVAAIYYYFLTEYQYMDMLLYLYALCAIFVIHMLFTPAFISASLGSLPFESFRAAFFTIKTKHIRFLGMYVLFAIAWLLNFIPLVQLFTVFTVYPIAYSALILLVSDKGGN